MPKPFRMSRGLPPFLGDNDNQKLLLDRHFAVFKLGIMVALGNVSFRFTQGGPRDHLIFQTFLILVALVVVLTRRKLPEVVTVSLLIVSTILFCMLGIVRYGLVAPTLLLLLLMPTITAVILGLIPALFNFAIIFVALIALSFRFLLLDIQPIVDLTGYMGESLNWIIFVLSFGVCSIWGVIIVSVQRDYWVSARHKIRVHDQFRFETKEKLEVADAWLNSVSENLPGVVFSLVRKTDGAYKIEAMSDGCEALLGHTAAALKDDFRLAMKCIDQEYWDVTQAIISHSAATMTSFQTRFPVKGSTENKLWLEVNGRPRPAKDREILWHCLALDITRQVQAEEATIEHIKQAEQTERQKNIGQLTGGISHDFNNLLAVIMGSMELLETTELTDEQRIHVKNCLETAQRGASLTKNMLSFAGQARLQPTRLNLNDVFNRWESWIGRTLPANVSIEMSLDPDLWHVRADESSTISALLNLIVNARDSMPLGGEIKIETCNVDGRAVGDAEGEKSHLNGDYVKVVITDTGSGMDFETLSHAFEPYYTTKSQTSGTGLGLPMVQGFMEQSEGSIEVQSEPGSGTTIVLYFKPDNKNGSKPVTKMKATTPKTTSARILLVEDEPAVLRVIKVILRNAGYSVVTAPSGDEAVEIFEKDDRFDLVVTDIVMAGELQGTTMAQHIRQTHPEQKFIFITGYSFDDPQVSTGIKPNDPRLEKPIKTAVLIAEIERVLAL